MHCTSLDFMPTLSLELPSPETGRNLRWCLDGRTESEFVLRRRIYGNAKLHKVFRIPSGALPYFNCGTFSSSKMLRNALDKLRTFVLNAGLPVSCSASCSPEYITRKIDDGGKLYGWTACVCDVWRGCP